MTARVRAGLVLIALFALGACDGTQEPTPFEAESPLLDVTTEAAPVVGVFETTVWYPHSACNTQASESAGGDFTIGADGFFCIRVSVKLGAVAATKGTVVFQVCDISGPGSGGRPAADCASGDGQWLTFARVRVDGSGEAEVRSRYQVINPSADGYRWRYIGQGSGVKNHSEPAFDVGSSG
jgi:hypothetical protein